MGALPAALRLNPDILAFIARFFPVIAYSRKRVPEDLQRDRTQDGLIARYCWIIQHTVARLPNDRVDLQFSSLKVRRHQRRGNVCVDVKKYLE